MQIFQDMPPKAWAAVMGGVGAVIGMTTIVSGLTGKQKAAMVGAGIALAVIFTPIVVEWVDLPESWSNGVSALIGIMGWTTVGKILLSIQKADVWGLFADIVRGRFGGRGGQ